MLFAGLISDSSKNPTKDKRTGGGVAVADDQRPEDY